ncbi:hypothetical protein PAPHI01_2479 [Pancytospora philotis]|nr:hypothetical protein PAPHI01_2479 [Pancytospora philotis]
MLLLIYHFLHIHACKFHTYTSHSIGQPSSFKNTRSETPMLQDAECRALEEALEATLAAPLSVTRAAYMATYDLVYSHCSESTGTYQIKGEEIYRIVKRKVAEYTSNLVFRASIAEFSAQAVGFRQTAVQLERIYSYIDRFFVRASVYRGEATQSIGDLFYACIYHNYVSRIEENLLGLIFLEFETSRRLFKQDCSALRTVVRFYLDTLRIVGQESKLVAFYRTYIGEYAANTSFSSDIRKLLKKVYLEMYYATSIIGERPLVRDIVSRIESRAAEAVAYTIQLAATGGAFKHAYKVVSVMDEGVRQQFKQAYTEMVAGRLAASSDFAGLFSSFVFFKEQIAASKMTGYEAEYKKIVSENFVDRGEADQLSLVKELLGRFDAAVGALEYEKGLRDGIVDVAQCPGVKKLDDLVDYLVIVGTEAVLGHYLTSCQARLIRGGCAPVEDHIAQRLAAACGPGAVSKIASSIKTYTSYHGTIFREGHRDGPSTLLMGTEHRSLFDRECVIARLFVHTSGFWRIGRDSTVLDPDIQRYVDYAVQRHPLGHRERLDVNHSLSAAVFEMNGTTYRMNGDLFNALFVLAKHGGRIKAAELKLEGEGKLERLAAHGFVSIEGEMVRLLNRQDSQKAINLYEAPDLASVARDAPNLAAQKRAVVESLISKFMKRLKKAEIAEVEEGLPVQSMAVHGLVILPDDIAGGIERLVEKGFLELCDGALSYVP